MVTPVSPPTATMTVNFALFGGTPTYRASGFIYGISPNGAAPSQSLPTRSRSR